MTNTLGRRGNPLAYSEQLLLTIPGSRGGDLLAIPPHLVGKSRTYIGELRQKSTGGPVVKRLIRPACPEGSRTEITVGPKDGYTRTFDFDRKLLVDSSDFFAAIYSEGGRLYDSDQTIRCYDIPVKALEVIERWLLAPNKCCDFDNRPKRTDDGVHILYVWRTADYLQMNGIVNVALDHYHNILRSEAMRTVHVQDFDFMYRYNLQFKPLFAWMLDCITFDYNNMRLPTIYWDQYGRAFNMADDEDLVPDHVGSILLKYPQIATAMLYTARRHMYLGFDKSSDPMNDTWDGTKGDSRFCRSHHDHLIGTVCVVPNEAPDVMDWEVEESDVEVDSDAMGDSE